MTLSNLSMDTTLLILSKLDEPDLARLRCVNTVFRDLIDTPVYPLQTLLSTYTTTFAKRHGHVLVRFLYRAKVGLEEGVLVRRFKRWMRHTKGISFGKYVYRMAKSVHKVQPLYDIIHHVQYRAIDATHELMYGGMLYTCIMKYVHDIK